MSMLQGKQSADDEIATMAASAIIPTAIRVVGLESDLVMRIKLGVCDLFLYDNNTDHTRLLMRKAKVAIGAGHREGVAVIAAGRNESRIETHRAFGHRGVLGVLRIRS